MRLLLLTIVLCSSAFAAAFNVTSITIIKNNAITTSACDDAVVGGLACNGSVAEFVTSASVGATGGTFNLNFSQATNNNTCPATPNATGAAFVQFLVTSSSYNSGSPSTRNRIVCGLHTLREPYNNAATYDATAGTTLRVWLSEPIFAGETVVMNTTLTSFYTDGSGNTLAAGSFTAGAAVTNNSILPYSSIPAMANWTRPGWQRISTANLNLYVTCFSHFAHDLRPCDSILYTASDAHSHFVSASVSVPTIDTGTLDPVGPSGRISVIEYIGSLTQSGLTQSDKIQACYRAYPSIGDETSVMDSCNANITGSVTSGAFVPNEQVRQGTTNATAYLDNIPVSSGNMLIGTIVSQTSAPDNSHTWVGLTSGAVYTPTAIPVLVNPQPSPLYSPQYYINDKGSTYGTAVAVVDTAAGNDANNCAVDEASYVQGTTPPGGACLTIDGGAVKMAAFNNANHSRNDVAGTMYLKAGNYAWTGASAAIPNTTANVWATITPFSGVSQSAVVINAQTGSVQSFGTQCTSGTTNCGTPIHIQGLTINCTTGPVSMFNNITYLWLDNDLTSFTNAATAPIFQVTIWYVTWGSVSNLSTNGLASFGTTNSSPALIRGVNVTGATLAYAYTFIGNINKTIGAFEIINFISGQTAPLSSMPIIAFNGMYRVNTAANGIVFLNNLNTATSIGTVVAQNVFEANSVTAQLVVSLSADSSTQTPVNNVMIWHNVITGGRINRGYNDSGTVIHLRQTWSEIGDIRDQEALKSDTFPTQSGNRVGNWSLLYGSSRRSVINQEITGGSTGFPATGTFQMEFGGLWSYNPTVTCGATQPCTSLTNSTINFPSYVSRLSYDGTSANAGNGNYCVKSNSPAVNTVPAGDAVLPYDLFGQIRDNSGYGSSGVCAQEVIRTGPFSW